jgi:hypothetical protein
MIPFDALTEVVPRKDDEHAKSDYFLNDFQLERREFAVPHAIRWDLKAVFGEGDEPAYDDHGEKWCFAVFQVTIPSNCHENVRTNEQKNSLHNARKPTTGLGIAGGLRIDAVNS